MKAEQNWNPEDDQNFVDFKGWRFKPPYRCLCCGVIVTLQQFCVGRTCGSCGTGKCNHFKIHQGTLYSGPREIQNRNDPFFLSEDKFRPIGELPAQQKVFSERRDIPRRKPVRTNEFPNKFSDLRPSVRNSAL